MTATNSKSFVHYQTLPMVCVRVVEVWNFSLTPTLSLRERGCAHPAGAGEGEARDRVNGSADQYAVYELYGLTEDEIKHGRV